MWFQLDICQFVITDFYSFGIGFCVHRRLHLKAARCTCTENLVYFMPFMVYHHLNTPPVSALVANTLYFAK